MTLFSATTARMLTRAFGARPDPAGAFRTKHPEAGAAPTYFGFAEAEVISELHHPPGRPECAVPEFAVTYGRVPSGLLSGLAVFAMGLARLMFAGSDSLRTGLFVLALNALVWWHGAASSRVVAGPRRARPTKIAIVVLAIGLQCLACEAAAQPAAVDPVLSIAPDMRGSASQFLVSQVSPPASVVPATPGAAPMAVPRAVPGAVRAAAAGKSDAPAKPPAQKWRVELGLGFVAGPKYPGSGKISAAPVPLVSVTYDDTFFVSSRQGIGAYLVQTENFKLGAAIGIAEDTRSTGKDAQLRGLPKIKAGGQASLFATYDLGPVAVEAAVHERIGTVNGVSATLGTTYRIRLTPDWSVMVGPELKVQSASLNDAFFGVTPAASRRAASYGNKISPYTPGAGIEAVSFTIASRYRASEHWTLLAKAGLGVLVGRDGDSPLTRNRFQPEIGMFAMYGF